MVSARIATILAVTSLSVLALFGCFQPPLRTATETDETLSLARESLATEAAERTLDQRCQSTPTQDVTKHRRLCRSANQTASRIENHGVSESHSIEGGDFSFFLEIKSDGLRKNKNSAIGLEAACKHGDAWTKSQKQTDNSVPSLRQDTHEVSTFGEAGDYEDGKSPGCRNEKTATVDGPPKDSIFANSTIQHSEDSGAFSSPSLNSRDDNDGEQMSPFSSSGTSRIDHGDPASGQGPGQDAPELDKTQISGLASRQSLCTAHTTTEMENLVTFGNILPQHDTSSWLPLTSDIGTQTEARTSPQQKILHAGAYQYLGTMATSTFLEWYIEQAVAVVDSPTKIFWIGGKGNPGRFISDMVDEWCDNEDGQGEEEVMDSPLDSVVA